MMDSSHTSMEYTGLSRGGLQVQSTRESWISCMNDLVALASLQVFYTFLELFIDRFFYP